MILVYNAFVNLGIFNSDPKAISSPPIKVEPTERCAMRRMFGLFTENNVATMGYKSSFGRTGYPKYLHETKNILENNKFTKIHGEVQSTGSRSSAVGRTVLVNWMVLFTFPVQVGNKFSEFLQHHLTESKKMFHST